MSGVVNVFAVEQGEWSDRRVLCLFDEESKAREYIVSLAKAERAKEAEEWGEQLTEPLRTYLDHLRLQLWSVVPVVRWKKWGELEPEEPA